MEYTHIIPEEDYLEHHGIKGMRWGVRRYQNPDGSLTEAGRRHYDIKEAKIKARGAAKVAKFNAVAAKKKAKVEAAEAKRSLKQRKRLAKIEEEKLKLDLKKMKQEAAYLKGKKFGDAFIPEFGKSFGRNVGEGLGKTIADWQKWKELNTARLDKKNAKEEKALARAKFKAGYTQQLQKDLTAANSSYYMNYAKYLEQLNKQIELDLKKQQGGTP